MTPIGYLSLFQRSNSHGSRRLFKKLLPVDNYTFWRRAVLNNQPCVIQVGDVNTYVSKLEHTIAETGSETFSVETASFQSGVTMSLIARIIDRNHIFLNICPVVSSLLSIDKAEFGENFVHLPQTNSRSMNSIIKVKGGETIVIGGLILQKKERSHQGLPVLARIPVLKWFFGTTEKRKTTSEIVILLTPIVGDLSL